MSYYAMRRVAMLRGVGAATFAKAQTDLTNQVVTVISAGDQYLAAVATSYDSGYYNDAVNAYQAAGNAAVIGVGPEIDGCGAPGITQPPSKPGSSTRSFRQCTPHRPALTTPKGAGQPKRMQPKRKG